MDVVTEEQTVTTKTFVITLTEAEVNTALVDARPLQRELRKARNAQIAPASNWATAGYAGHPSRTVKAKRGRPAKAEKKIPRPSAHHKAGVQAAQPCPYGCGQDVKPSGLGRHRLKCPRYQLHQVAVKAQSAAVAD